MRRVAVAMSFSSSGEWTAPSPRNGARKSLRTTRCRAVQQLHDGACNADEHVHRAGDGQRDAFGALQGEGFGDKFAEQDFKVSDE